MLRVDRLQLTLRSDSLAKAFVEAIVAVKKKPRFDRGRPNQTIALMVGLDSAAVGLPGGRVPASSNPRSGFSVLNPLRLEAGDSRLQTRVPELEVKGTLATVGAARFIRWLIGSRDGQWGSPHETASKSASNAWFLHYLLEIRIRRVQMLFQASWLDRSEE